MRKEVYNTPRTENCKCKRTYCSIGIYASQKIVLRKKKKQSVFVSRSPTICLNCAKIEKKHTTGHWRNKVRFIYLRDAENGLR
jgi:hypothetical protein